jgi:hypothetical protein
MFPHQDFARHSWVNQATNITSYKLSACHPRPRLSQIHYLRSMKKVTVVFISVFILSIIYSCCKEVRYKTTLSALEYSGKGFQSNETDTIFASQQSTILLSFKIDNDFTEIAMGSLLSTSMAKGGEDCNEYIQEKYEDPITQIYFACDRDLSGIDANENFPDYHFGLTYQSPYEVIYHERDNIIELLNDNTEEGDNVWLSISPDKFLSAGKYKFTLRFTTQSGKVIQATSRELVVML